MIDAITLALMLPGMLATGIFWAFMLGGFT
jgi:hypothetical protein